VPFGEALFEPVNDLKKLLINAATWSLICGSWISGTHTCFTAVELGNKPIWVFSGNKTMRMIIPGKGVLRRVSG
jgi:hypothetical protein